MSVEETIDYTDREFDHYKIIRKIASGGMGSVYLAHHKNLDKDYAVKILPTKFARNKSFVDRFRREAMRASDLSHLNIVPVINFGKIDDTYFLVMPYIEGQNLKNIVREKTPTVKQAVNIIKQTAEGLSYAHKHNLVHRDIKPGNLIITPTGEVKITDFGLARQMEGEDINVTMVGDVLGTPMYMGKEQWLGEGVDHRTDIYALGVTFYEVLTGETPFAKKIPPGRLAQLKLNDDFIPPSKFSKDVNKDLEDICLKMMSFEVEDRYQNIDDVIKDLDKWIKNLSKDKVEAEIKKQIAKTPEQQETVKKEAKKAVENKKSKQTIKDMMIVSSPKLNVTATKKPAGAIGSAFDTPTPVAIEKPKQGFKEFIQSEKKKIANIKTKAKPSAKSSKKRKIPASQVETVEVDLSDKTSEMSFKPRMYLRFYITVPLCWIFISFVLLLALFNKQIPKDIIEKGYKPTKRYIDAGISLVEDLLGIEELISEPQTKSNKTQTEDNTKSDKEEDKQSKTKEIEKSSKEVDDKQSKTEENENKTTPENKSIKTITEDETSKTLKDDEPK